MQTAAAIIDTKSSPGFTTPRPSHDDDDGVYLPVTKLRRKYLDYLGGKSQEIEEQRESRHYYHGSQWNSADVEILRKRGQPKITYNRISRKIDGIVGLVLRQRQDPKAYPRTPRKDSGAEVATAVVRAVCDANDMRALEFEALQQAGIEGIGGCELLLRDGDHGDPDIMLRAVASEDFFYDPRSYKPNFSDATYMGVAKWIGIDEAIELFPDQEDVIEGLLESGSDLTTNTDREYKWLLTNERRIRLVEHWYRNKGKWCWAFYIADTLLDEGISPFLDERGKTMCRFFMFSAAVDHDGDRYGFVRNLKGPQDEVNQRRSKALWTANTRRLIMEKGAVDDVETTRREWARPDGVVETNKGFDFKPDDTAQDLAAQFQFLEEAKNEIEAFANTNPLSMMGAQARNLSGRAVNMLQQPGMAELGRFLNAFRSWKLSIYRGVWNTAQQFWTAERWIRVTDDQNLAKYLQVNGLKLDEYGRPSIINAIGALDVDIILDEGPDVVNMMADTFDVMRDMIQSGTQLPPQAVIEMAPLQSSVKQRVLATMQPPTDGAQETAKRLALEDAAASIELKHAKAAELRSKVTVDAARAGHLNSQANLNAADAFQTAVQSAATPTGLPQTQLPGQPQQPQQQGFGNQNPMMPPGPPGQPLPPTGIPQGARQAPDGRHYIPDPNRPGKFLMVA